jgi:hypothetical protein
MCGSYDLAIQTAGGDRDTGAEAVLFGVVDAREVKRIIMEKALNQKQLGGQPQMTALLTSEPVGNLEETNKILHDIRDTLHRIEDGKKM